MSKARLGEQYKEKIRPALMDKLNIKNIMSVPRLEKIVLNVGVKEAVSDSRILKKVADIVQEIAGQVPVKTKARESIAGFKIREGMPIGVKVTLRRDAMYNFFDKLIFLALPKVRDFHGLKKKLDGRGNYNLGLKEWNIFPEAERLAQDFSKGINITLHTSAQQDAEALALLEEFGMPFKRS